MVKLSDGSVTTLEANKWTMMLHFGNAYMRDADTIVVEGPAYERPDRNVFADFTYESLRNLTQIETGNRFKRYILNLKDKTVNMEDLILADYGQYDLPQYNPLYEGRQNRYTYMLQTF